MLKYLENHPYKTAIGTIIGIIGIVLTIIFYIFPLSTNSENENIKYVNTYNTTESKNTKYVSAFDLLEKIYSEKSTLAKQNKLSEYYNYNIKDDGFIIDAEKDIFNNNIITTIVKNLEKDKYNKYSKKIIECTFTNDWNKILVSDDFPKEIKFKGKIPDENNNMNEIFVKNNISRLRITDCIIEN